MPWTFAHPAAVLPLKRYMPRLTHLGALVLGSIVPDLGYYIGRFDISSAAHTLPGAFLVDLPFGLLLFAVLMLLRKPVGFLLPQPFRGALRAAIDTPAIVTPTGAAIIATSIVLGALTHNLWDSFTHPGRWGVQHVAWLQGTAFQVGQNAIPVYYLAQHASTVVGVLVLAQAFRAWLRDQPAALRQTDPFGEPRRWGLLAGTGCVAFAAAMLIISPAADTLANFYAARVFVFQAAVYSTAIFASLLVALALLIQVARDGQRSDCRR